MQPEPIQVMTVEDDPSFRKLLAVLLGACGRFRVHAADLDRWLEDVHETPPDILLLDLTLDAQDAVPHIPGIVAACPTTMVAALTARPAEDEERSVLNAGAFTFYEKTRIHRLPDDLAEDLVLFRKALDGHDIVAPSALSRRQTTNEPAASRSTTT